jgi:hypothetical protein
MYFGVPKCLEEKIQENLSWEGQDPRKIEVLGLNNIRHHKKKQATSSS